MFLSHTESGTMWGDELIMIVVIINLVCAYQITLYTLNMYTFCQLYLNKAGKRKQV